MTSNVLHAFSDATDRVEQLRNRLRDIADTIPPPARSSIDPGYSALVLANDEAETRAESLLFRNMENLRASLSPEARARLQQFETRPLRSDAVGHTLAATAGSSWQPYPVIGNRRALHSGEAWLSSRLSDRLTSDAEDGQTSLGRRIAVRADSGRRTEASETSNAILASIHQEWLDRARAISRDLDSVSQRLSSAMEQVEEQTSRLRSSSDNSQFSAAMDFLRGTTPSIADSSTADSRLSTTPSRRSLILNSHRMALGRSLAANTVRTRQAEHIVNTILPPEDELARDHVLADFNDSLVMSRDLATRRMAADTEGNIFRARGSLYTIHRFLNADGDEVVHEVNSDGWDEGSHPSRANIRQHNRPRPFSRSLRPRNISIESERESRTEADSQPTSQLQGQERRRGWARLDLDGNEIPTEEEEELERSRTHFRLLAQREGRSTQTLAAHADSEYLPPGIHELDSLVPTTRLSMPHTTVGDRGNVARVRLGSLQATESRDARDAVTEKIGDLDNALDRTVKTRIYPLPMRLSEMNVLPTRAKQDAHATVIVLPKQAGFAGR